MLTSEIPAAVFEKANSDYMLGAEPKPEEIDAEQLLPDEGTNGLGICLLQFLSSSSSRWLLYL